MRNTLVKALILFLSLTYFVTIMFGMPKSPEEFLLQVILLIAFGILVAMGYLWD